MKDNQKHIVLLTSEFPPLPGGIGNHAYGLAEQLCNTGYRVSVIADQRDTKNSEEAFDTKLKSKICRVSISKPRVFMYLKRIWVCYKLAKSADVLICSGKFPLWIGAILKPFISTETVAIIHGTEVNFSDSKLRKSIHWSLKRFKKIVAVSNFTKSLVEDLKLQNIKVIPNGFSIKELSNREKVSVVLKGYPKLLTVGSVTERKGQVNVIKHLPQLLKEYPNLHYHCVGFKMETEKFQQVAKSLKVSDHITFYGHVSHSALREFYTNSDICVMLSQTTETGDVEGFGIALIEANYFGLPTIGAKGCGIEDAVSNHKSGILIDTYDSEAFSNAVKTILEDNTYYKTNAKIWANDHRWEEVIKRYVDYIEA